jgi:non-specific serine/threonine protein kinase
LENKFDSTILTSARSLATPLEIAQTLNEASKLVAEPKQLPRVEIFLVKTRNLELTLELRSQSGILGDLVDLATLHPLDRILLKEISEVGSYNREGGYWNIKHNADFDRLFLFLGCSSKVYGATDKTVIKIVNNPINVAVEIKWVKEGAFFELLWNDKSIIGTPELLGTPPAWIVFEDTIRPLDNVSRSLANLFIRSPRLFVSFSNLSSILDSYPLEKDFIVEKNEEFRPTIRYVSAKPIVTLSSRIEHDIFSVIADLDFQHIADDYENRIINMPERWDREEIDSILNNLGFNKLRVGSKYKVEGETALDLAYEGSKAFPVEWTVEGMEEVSKSVRFSRLSVDVSLVKSSQQFDDNKFFCNLSLLQNNGRVPFSSLFKSTRSFSQKWVKLDSGAYAKIPGGSLGRLHSILGIVDSNFRMSNTIDLPMSPAQVIGMASLDQNDFSLRLDSYSTELIERIKNFESLPEVPTPDNFTGLLRDYQRSGVNWLFFIHEFNFGGILADEMGLGKTIQTLALLQFLKNSNTEKRGPHLIVAPTSVVTNWHYEIQKFTPEIKSLVLQGTQRREYMDKLNEYDIILSTYPLLRVDREYISAIDWDYIILDEAQYIKNPTTSTARVVKSLRSKHRLALTGTPTENRPMELWSLMDFLMPGYLGTGESFRTSWEKKIMSVETHLDSVEMLRSRVAPFILRRTKNEVEKDLPAKIESIQHVEMTPIQRELYQQVLMDLRTRVFAEVEKKGIGGASISILSALLRLRQICNHPRSISDFSDIMEYDSGKFQLFQALLLEALENGRKVLVFSQFIGMLSLMREWIDTLTYKYVYLDGATKDRQPLIERFNNDESVRLFLISLKAGGTGLNLTAADTVILYDPWWNPAVENQAVDRAHRIGQTKAVNVYRLVTENSIEQHIFRLKESKEQLFDSLVGVAGSNALKLTKEDLETLFNPLA